MTIENYFKKELYKTTYKDGHKYIDGLFNLTNKKTNIYDIIERAIKSLFLDNKNNILTLKNDGTKSISLQYEGISNMVCLYMLMHALKRVASLEKIDFNDIIKFMNNID